MVFYGSVYYFLPLIALSLVLPNSAVSVNALQRKIDTLIDIIKIMDENYNQTLNSLNVVRQWKKSTEDMSSTATRELQEMMAKTTAEAMRKAESDSDEAKKKLDHAKLALAEAEAELHALSTASEFKTKSISNGAESVVTAWVITVAFLMSWYFQ